MSSSEECVKCTIFHPSVIEVENEAFYDCKQLRKVIFHDGLKKIGQQAFYYCKSLSSIKFPSTITEIGEWAPFKMYGSII